MKRVLVGSAVGALVAAALVYYLDPVMGPRRRRTLRKQSANLARQIGDGVNAAQLTRYGARRINILASRLRNAAAHF